MTARLLCVRPRRVHRAVPGSRHTLPSKSYRGADTKASSAAAASQEVSLCLQDIVVISPDPGKTQSTGGTVLSVYTAPRQPGACIRGN